MSAGVDDAQTIVQMWLSRIGFERIFSVQAYILRVIRSARYM